MNHQTIPGGVKRFRFGVNKKSLQLLVILSILLGATFGIRKSQGKPSMIDLKSSTFNHLKQIRDRKKHELVSYFDNIADKAFKAGQDNRLHELFLALKEGADFGNRQIESELDIYYVRNYDEFYDLLFVDSSGYVFHSIKKEADYRTNIWEGPMGSTNLVAQLRQSRGTFFSEYEYYGPSSEPAAFFVTPIQLGGIDQGWIILQTPINEVNTILTARADLGRTGEVYLINSDKLMLSDSRFVEDATILKLKVDTKSVERALKSTSGESIIEDYRGILVFSSFEKISLFGTHWIIIAEIDEEEVYTDYYLQHKGFLQREIERYLEKQERRPQPARFHDTMIERVDMNEYAKVPPGRVGKTYGVATCTALVLLYPEKFGYMAHVSPTDDIYNSSWFSQLPLRHRNPNMLDELMHQIRRYDLLPVDLQNLQVFLVAPHLQSLWRSVDILLAHDLDVGNIRVIYNPNAESVNVELDIENTTLQVEWYTGGNYMHESAFVYPSLSTIIKNILISGG